MSGFPVRPSRTAFGPKPQNRFPVRSNEFEMDGPTTADLLLWQVSGLGVSSALAWALGTFVGGPSITAAPEASAESWDPDGASAPTFARTGLGSYTLTYVATNNDKDGVAIATNLLWAQVHVQTLSVFYATAEINANKRVVDIRVRDAAFALADPGAGHKLIVHVG